MSLIVACGLGREARLIERPGYDAKAIAGGGNAARLEAMLEMAADLFPGIVLSSGIAGALDPALRPGDVVVDGTPPIAALLRAALPHAIPGAIVGGDAIVATAAAKRALAATGAIAADMESHIARRVAARHGLPFAAIRTISDAADDDLPPAALVGMAADGRMALGRVLASLARHPAQLPALIRTGRHAGRAFRALGLCHDALARARIDRLDLREFALDMG